MAQTECMHDTTSDDSTPSWAERWVRFLDDGLAIPGTSLRIGADGLLGFFMPAVGDAASAVMSASLFALAWQRRVPTIVLTQMAVNVCLDTVFGSIPVVGDLFDVIFKANRKNLNLIERHKTSYSGRAPFSSYVVVGFAAVAVVASMIAPALFLWWLAKQI